MNTSFGTELLGKEKCQELWPKAMAQSVAKVRRKLNVFSRSRKVSEVCCYSRLFEKSMETKESGSILRTLSVYDLCAFFHWEVVLAVTYFF